ncbi:hypothetical protein N658DRAFT_527343 [Parathielavia hyrcaniae]|uniref:Ankyrin n=1 Tax=Parathielavia hyrcaniae TaxID=113614 RepID=A0AAN6PSB2_9PEZI|nr:hypothetical protein N658DRAFT_527343 [Parathielavia hyrcaniae]
MSEIVRAILREMPYSVHFQAYQTGFTALHYACVKYDAASAEILRLLLRAGADFDAENDYGQSAGSIAASQILLGLMPSYLLTKVASRTSVSRLADGLELSPVTEVVLGSRLGNVEKMLANMPPERLKLTELDNRGNTPLHWAARAGDMGVVKALVKCGIDISIRTMSGKITPDRSLRQHSWAEHRVLPLAAPKRRRPASGRPSRIQCSHVGVLPQDFTGRSRAS